MALPGETCRTIANRLAVHGLERVPVVTDAQSRRLVGIISRSDLVKPSRWRSPKKKRFQAFRRMPLRGPATTLQGAARITAKLDHFPFHVQVTI